MILNVGKFDVVTLSLAFPRGRQMCFLNPRGDLRLPTFLRSRQNVKFLVKSSTYFDWISIYVVNQGNLEVCFLRIIHYVG